jgi:phage shock protein C
MTMNTEKRLCRSSSQKMIAGVCGGIAEYLGWDVTIVRLLWIVLTLAGGSGILIYLILWLVMPQNA